jgi:predicted nucleic acid-binding Zn ribbon protein
MAMTKNYDKCLRCGKGVPWGQSVCQDCNPAGLPSPSVTQYHATVFLSVLAVLAVMAVLALVLT